MHESINKAIYLLEPRKMRLEFWVNNWYLRKTVNRMERILFLLRIILSNSANVHFRSSRWNSKYSINWKSFRYLNFSFINFPGVFRFQILFWQRSTTSNSFSGVERRASSYRNNSLNGMFPANINTLNYGFNLWICSNSTKFVNYNSFSLQSVYNLVINSYLLNRSFTRNQQNWLYLICRNIIRNFMRCIMLYNKFCWIEPLKGLDWHCWGGNGIILNHRF